MHITLIGNVSFCLCHGLFALMNCVLVGLIKIGNDFHILLCVCVYLFSHTKGTTKQTKSCVDDKGCDNLLISCFVTFCLID